MLPALKGTPKQIAWAERIRTDSLARWKKSDPVKFSELAKQTASSWWIANKDKELEEVLGVTVKSSTTASSSKPKGASMPTITPTSDKMFETKPDGSTRYVGELRDAATGELVVDEGCPF
jgi:hypothetical protein